MCIIINKQHVSGDNTENIGQNKNRPDEYNTRLISPLEQRILRMTKEEKNELLSEMLEQLNEAEQVIHTINRVNDEYTII